MANEEHVALLKQGVIVWNTWRGENPDIVLDLVDAKLSGANLRNAKLRNAKLVDAKLSGANLRNAKLRNAKLVGADLGGALLVKADLVGADLRNTKLINADLSGANLRGASLRGALLDGANLASAFLVDANLTRADLSGADLHNADLQKAMLIDSRLDGANLTGAKLWETQRAGWSIKEVICRWAFWDRDGMEPDEYGDGDFERIYAQNPRIVLRYPGGMSPVDLAMLPLIIEDLQGEHPDCALHIRSVQDDGSGAMVTITVEDLAGRKDNAFKIELAHLQTELRCVVGERDYLRQLLGPVFSEAASIIRERLRLPTQTINLHGQSGPVTIEGINMGDTYNTGQAGAVGPKTHAHDMAFQQIQNQGALDLPRLAEELARLRAAMKQESEGTAEQDEAIGAVAKAEKAAGQGDDRTMLRHLKTAGRWTLGMAEKIGVAVAAEAIKRAM